MVQHLVHPGDAQSRRGHALPPRLGQMPARASLRGIVANFAAMQQQEVRLHPVRRIEMPRSPVGEAAQPGECSHVDTGVQPGSNKQVQIAELGVVRSGHAVVCAVGVARHRM